MKKEIQVPAHKPFHHKKKLVIQISAVFQNVNK